MGRSIRKQRDGARHVTGEAAAATPIRSAEAVSEIPSRKQGRALRLLRGAVQFPYTFVAMNGAAVVGLYAFLRNRKDIWVRTADVEAWETLPEPTVSLSTARSHSVRKAA